MTPLRFLVSDLVDRPGERRVETGKLELDLRVGESQVTGPAAVEVVLEGIDGGVMARFTARYRAHLVCNRCLVEWDEAGEVSAVQVYEESPDDDGYALGDDDTVDLSGPVRDEVALAVPLRPLCRPDCRGLCPTCGSDLNRDPCQGHDEGSDSPFAVLEGLFADRSSDQSTERSSDRDVSQS